jgi:hypothetical protein
VTSSPNVPPENAPGTVKTEPPPANNRIAATVLQTAPQEPEAIRYKGFELWLHRLTVLMLVFVCAVVGVLLVILPWRPEWTDNRLLLTFPALRSVVSNGFVRGLCSGLGILDIWIGFWEAIHYHEGKPR